MVGLAVEKGGVMHILVGFGLVFVAGLFGGGWFRSEVDDDEETTGSRISRNGLWAAAAVAGVWLWMRKR